MNKKSFLYGASILSLGAIITRVLGAVYRVPLTRVLGSFGMGLYQLVFPIYALLVVVSTSGMPHAVSKMVASCQGDQKAKKSIIKRSLVGIFLFSLVLSVILVIFCEKLAVFQGNRKLSISYLSIAPAVIFVGIISVLRGYFQGEQNYVPTAISQIVEQLVKIGVGLGLSYTLLPYGVEYAVVGAIVGVSASELVACIILAIQYTRDRKKYIINKLPSSVEINIFKSIWPILVGSILFPLANVVDSLIVVKLLRFHFDQQVATAIYGIESGAVSSILNLPCVFSTALASSILPAISSQTEESKASEIISKCLKVNLVIILPCVLGLIFFASPIMHLLYGSSLNFSSIDGLRLGASILAMSSMGMFYVSFNSVIIAILQAKNKSLLAVKNLSIGLIVKYAVQIPFMLVNSVNIYGLVVGNLACYVMTFLLNYRHVAKYVWIENEFYIRLITANILSIGLGVALYYLMPRILGFTLAMFVVVVVYFLLYINSPELAVIKDKIFRKKCAK